MRALVICAVLHRVGVVGVIAAGCHASVQAVDHVAPAPAAGLQFQHVLSRCEGAGGTVTYTDTACPQGTTRSGSVAPVPAPSANDQAAARERTRREVAALRGRESADARAQAQAYRDASRRKAEAERARERCARSTLAAQRAQQRFDVLQARPLVPATEARADAQLLKAQQAQALACRAVPPS